MKRTALRTFAEVEQKMMEARRLRSETAKVGCQRVFAAFLSLARGVVDRWRGTGRVALPS